jgi:hypothetical protein
VDSLAADSGGRWGPLLTIDDVRGFAPMLFNVALAVDGSTIALGRVAYRWDPALAAAPEGNLEFNGPGGRWLVGATATRTDQEAAPAVPPTILAAFPPRITFFRVPLSTTTRSILVRLGTQGGTARVTRARFSVAGRAFGSWIPLASSYRVVLPAGSATRTIRVQVRDSLGLRSSIVSRRVRCGCG